MEISNVGVDIVNIERFRKKEYDKNKKFYDKIFSKSEIQYCLSFKNNSEHFAGKFAIKEAVKKSIKENIGFKEILNIFQDEIQVPKWVASEENSESFNNFLNKLSKLAKYFL